jgi:16S rRNA (guanine527-N7)-methyltransferase
MQELIVKYFPSISEVQKEQFSALKPAYEKWNSMINVISRKDMDNFVVHHVLHSLSIAKIFTFNSETRVLDIGTGGGFPGIPLAIMFPDTEFTLLDSIEKKIKVVKAVSEELGLKNVIPVRLRAEEEKGKYRYVVSRAVTEFGSLVKLTEKNILTGNFQKGIISLKGGDLSEELREFKSRVKIWNISDLYEDTFFETKKIIYLPL